MTDDELSGWIKAVVAHSGRTTADLTAAADLGFKEFCKVAQIGGKGLRDRLVAQGITPPDTNLRRRAFSVFQRLMH